MEAGLAYQGCQSLGNQFVRDFYTYAFDTSAAVGAAFKSRLAKREPIQGGKLTYMTGVSSSGDAVFSTLDDPSTAPLFGFKIEAVKDTDPVVWSISSEKMTTLYVYKTVAPFEGLGNVRFQVASPSTKPYASVLLQILNSQQQALQSDLTWAKHYHTNMKQWWVYDQSKGTLTSYADDKWSYDRVRLGRTRDKPNLFDPSQSGLHLIAVDEDDPDYNTADATQGWAFYAQGDTANPDYYLFDTRRQVTYGPDLKPVDGTYFGIQGVVHPYAQAALAAAVGMYPYGGKGGPDLVVDPGATCESYKGPAAKDPTKLQCCSGVYAEGGKVNVTACNHPQDNDGYAYPDCPWSTYCMTTTNQQNIMEYCAQLDESGYPRMNTDVNCRKWKTQNDPLYTQANDAFCKKYPFHTACACMNYTQSDDYKAIEDAFLVARPCSHATFSDAFAPESGGSGGNDGCSLSGDDYKQPGVCSKVNGGKTSASPGGGSPCCKDCRVIPAPECWAPPCTQHLGSDGPNSPLKSFGQLTQATCKGLSLNFCNQLVCFLCVNGNIHIDHNKFSQVCGSNPPVPGPAPAPSPSPGPGPGPNPSPSPGPGPSPSPPDKKKTLIYAGVGVAAAVILVVIIAALARGRKKPAS